MPPDEDLYALDQLEQAERLRQVLVGARAKAAHLVRLLATRRQHQHGRVETLAAQPLQDLEAIDAGQHHVENQQLRLTRARRAQTTRPVRLVRDVVAFQLQVVADRRRQLAVVFDQQDVMSLNHFAQTTSAWSVSVCLAACVACAPSASRRAPGVASRSAPGSSTTTRAPPPGASSM